MIFSLIIISGLTSAAGYSDYQYNAPIKIIFSSDLDYESAKLIKNSLLTDYNAILISDMDYVDDGISNIISVGGSCVNKISANIMGYAYPSCGSYANLASGQYLVKTYQSPNRWVIVVAGYNEDDTWNAAVEFLSHKKSYLYDSNYYDENAQYYEYGYYNSYSHDYPINYKKTYHFVNIKNFAFSPNSITINEGDTIIWANYDDKKHTIRSYDYGYLNSPVMNYGNTYSYTFDYPGTYSYYCSIHPEMQGQIIVKPYSKKSKYYDEYDNYYGKYYDDNYYYESAYDYSGLNKDYNEYYFQEYPENFYVYYKSPDDYAIAKKYFADNYPPDYYEYVRPFQGDQNMPFRGP